MLSGNLFNYARTRLGDEDPFPMAKSERGSISRRKRGHPLVPAKRGLFESAIFSYVPDRATRLYETLPSATLVGLCNLLDAQSFLNYLTAPTGILWTVKGEIEDCAPAKCSCRDAAHIYSCFGESSRYPRPKSSLIWPLDPQIFKTLGSGQPCLFSGSCLGCSLDGRTKQDTPTWLVPSADDKF